jgi:hypothetical protein
MPAFDARAIACGGRVVQCQQPAGTGVDGAAQVAEEDSGGHRDLAAAEGAEHGVGAAEVVGDAAGPEPGRGGTTAVGQEFSKEKRFDEFGMAFVEEASYLVQERVNRVRRPAADHNWLSESGWQGDGSNNTLDRGRRALSDSRTSLRIK